MNSIDSTVSSFINKTFAIRTNYTSPLILAIDGSASYFLLNTHSVFLWTVPQTALLVLFLVVMKVLFKKLYRVCRSRQVVPVVGNIYMEVKQKSVLIKTIVRFCKENSTVAFVLVSVVEANCISMCFYAGVQLRLCFSHLLLDKLNLAVTLLMLFACLMVSSVLYILLWALGVRRTKKLTERQKWRFENYSLTSCLSFFRTFVVGFLQGLFFSDYRLLMSLLALTKLLQLLLLLFFSKQYRRCFSFSLKFLSLLLAILFDLFLLLVSLQKKYAPSMVLEWAWIVEAVLIGGIVVTTVLAALQLIVEMGLLLIKSSI